jgi:hypothetical protein
MQWLFGSVIDGRACPTKNHGNRLCDTVEHLSFPLEGAVARASPR